MDLTEKYLEEKRDFSKKVIALMKKHGIDPEKELKKGKSEREIMVAFYKKYLPQRP